MLGTIVNTAAVIIGSLVGLLIKNGIKEKYRTAITQAVGLAVLFIGLSGALAKLIQPEANLMLTVISLVLGGFVGEAIDIDKRINTLGDFLQRKLSVSEGGFSKGFVTASLLFCVGTMAILGSLESGTQGIHNTLFAKSVLDGISAMIFASYLGIGVIFSAGSVFVYQGTLTLLAGFIAPFLTENMLFEIAATGGILLTGLGFDLLGIKKMKVSNLLPAIFVPVIYYSILKLI